MSVGPGKAPGIASSEMQPLLEQYQQQEWEYISGMNNTGTEVGRSPIIEFG